jgi:hypothetical protein
MEKLKPKEACRAVWTPCPITLLLDLEFVTQHC